jgi:hypothetical protein
MPRRARMTRARRSVTMDSWSAQQLKMMQAGGNDALNAFVSVRVTRPNAACPAEPRSALSAACVLNTAIRRAKGDGPARQVQLQRRRRVSRQDQGGGGGQALDRAAGARACRAVLPRRALFFGRSAGFSSCADCGRRRPLPVLARARQVTKESHAAPHVSRSASAANQMQSAGGFEESWGWGDSQQQQQQQQQQGASLLCCCVRAPRRSIRAHTRVGSRFAPACNAPGRPMRHAHSANEMPSGGAGGYTMDQLNTSAAGKDVFFARKMQENASRCATLSVGGSVCVVSMCVATRSHAVCLPATAHAPQARRPAAQPRWQVRRLRLRASPGARAGRRRRRRRRRQQPGAHRRIG